MTSPAREVAGAAALCALGVVLPILFHMVGLGRFFLPMHLPVLVAGLVLPPRIAWTVGLVVPWLSSFLTGMPPMPMPVLMGLELVVLAETAALLRAGRVPVWVAGPVAVAARCAVTYAASLALAPLLGLPPAAAGLASVVAGVPGIILQVALAPVVALAGRRTPAPAP